MKAAILGNGPSRVAYSPADYDLVLGCNFPWCPVDGTVIVDHAVAGKFANHPELMESVPSFYLSEPIHRKLYLKRNRYPSIQAFLNKCVRVFPHINWESSGHAAAQQAIESGATELWIFGCDSYFDYTVESCTSAHISNNVASPDRYVQRWRRRWQEKVNWNKGVTFNFVRGIDDYTTAVHVNLSKVQKR